MKVFVIVQGVPGIYVTVKGSEVAAKELIKELNDDNKEMLGFELEYRILEKMLD